MEEKEYVMTGKGRTKEKKLGGGVALLHRKSKGLSVEEIDVGNSAVIEDVLAARVECRDVSGRSEKVIVVVVYMTVEGERAAMQGEQWEV